MLQLYDLSSMDKEKYITLFTKYTFLNIFKTPIEIGYT